MAQHRSPTQIKQATNKTFPVRIQKLDYRGQGISWDLDRITFIPQALPGEIVTIRLTKIQAAQQWGQICQILQPSPQRITPDCPHYTQCGGCHYRHLPYSAEWTAKMAVLQEQLTRLGKIDLSEVSLHAHPANARSFYRQRLQLHYHTAQNKIGLLRDGEIVEIPHCQLPLPALRPAFAELYPPCPAHRSWPTNIAPTGHLELAVQDGQIKKHWNRPYAADGFCQVNPTMNEALKKVWQEIFQQWPIPPGHHGVIDLFGGNGNLSQLCAATTPVLVVDAYPVEGSPLPFIQADLYAPSALALVQAAATTHQIQPPLAWLILDPPRSGHQQIALWAQAWRPQNILYVSCNAATLARDLTTLLPEYRLHSLELFDFFPGTYHFETMAVLTRKN